MDFAVEGVNNTWNFYMLGPFPEPRERVGGVGSTFSMPVITSNSSDGSLDVAVKGPSKSLLFYTAARGTATPTFTGMPVAGPGTTQK
jgi:hypothetical protein